MQIPRLIFLEFLGLFLFLFEYLANPKSPYSAINIASICLFDILANTINLWLS